MARPDQRERLNLLKLIAPSDVVTVARSDHLACSTFDRFGMVTQIVNAGGPFRSLAEWWDTATSTGRSMIAVPDRLAGAMRDRIHSRTAEGRQPDEGARAAHGTTAEAFVTAAEGITAAAARGHDARKTRQELQSTPGDDCTAVGGRLSGLMDNPPGLLAA